jgi:hypothetical protein
VHAFRPPNTLQIGLQFSESLGISNILLSLGFGIPLLLHLILLALPMLILWLVGFDRKSTTDTCHFLGSFLVCWSSQKQSSVSQSTMEAEYVAATPKSYGSGTP